MRSNAAKLNSGDVQADTVCLQHCAAVQAAASNSNLRWLQVPATKFEALENVMFSRAFCCPDFDANFRSWKRRGSGRRKVAAQNRRGLTRRNDSIVIAGVLRVPLSTAPFDKDWERCRPGRGTSYRSRIRTRRRRAIHKLGAYAMLRGGGSCPVERFS